MPGRALREGPGRLAGWWRRPQVGLRRSPAAHGRRDLAGDAAPRVCGRMRRGARSRRSRSVSRTSQGLRGHRDPARDRHRRCLRWRIPSRRRRFFGPRRGRCRHDVPRRWPRRRNLTGRRVVRRARGRRGRPFQAPRHRPYRKPGGRGRVIGERPPRPPRHRSCRAASPAWPGWRRRSRARILPGTAPSWRRWPPRPRASRAGR